MAEKIMTGKRLAETALDAANNYKTLYVAGCFGAPMTEANKKRYTQNHEYNMAADRAKLINAAAADTFGFDCVCLIKGLLWGWCGDASKEYGGAVYASNGVPDVGEDAMIAMCGRVSTDFSGIEAGEAVWLPGHIGVYAGGGLAVECTPVWKNGVQVTAVGNLGAKAGYDTRTWAKHGRLPWVDYNTEEDDDMPIYKDFKDVPGCYQAAVKKAVDKGALKGDGNGLNLSEDLCRTLTVLDRLGKLD